MRKIIVMAGLPGAGKSHLAKRLQSECKPKAQIWDVDSYAGTRLVWKNKEQVKESNLTDLFRELKYDWKHSNYNYIMDGLFLNNKSYSSLIENLMKIDDIKESDFIFEFYFFEPDVEACLWNDKMRNREKSATATIRNAIVEKPDLSILTKLTNSTIKVINCTTERVEEFEVNYKNFKKDHRLYDDKLQSDYWSKGGDHCDYNGDCYDCKDEEDLELLVENFSEFARLVDQVIPNLDDGLMQELLVSTCSYFEYSESDYYGGTQNLKCFQCDLKYLYELLDEKGLIVMGQMVK